MDREILLVGVSLCVLGVLLIVYVLKNRKIILNEAQSVADLKISRAQSQADMKAEISAKCSQNILEKAEKKQNDILKQAQHRADLILQKSKSRAREVIELAKRKRATVIAETKREQLILIETSQGVLANCEERINELKCADQELQERLKQSKLIIKGITDKSYAYAADIALLSGNDLLSVSNYQDEMLFMKSSLKKLAVNAVVGIESESTDKDIVNLVSISAKADLAGALLLTTVEMLCSRTTVYNGPQSLEKLSESILVTEALVKCIDSRAKINEEFKELLMKRLEAEIHCKKAEQLSEEQPLEFREQLLEEQ